MDTPTTKLVTKRRREFYVDVSPHFGGVPYGTLQDAITYAGQQYKEDFPTATTSLTGWDDVLVFELRDDVLVLRYDLPDEVER